MTLRAAALLGAILLVSAGCSGSSDRGRSSATTTHEAAGKVRTQDVAWLVLLHKWENRMGRRGTVATTVADGVRTKARKQSELDAAVRPLEQCAATLDTDVGAPLVRRYREGYALYRSACADVAAWGRALDDAAGSNDVTEVEEKEQQVEASLDEAQRQLSSSFLAVEPLPVKGGDVSSSRIEPRFGRALNRLVYKSADAAQIEVRCWSKKEWPKVKYEYGGYAGNVDFAGFAYDQIRISVAPEYCASLVDLVYRHERPTSGLPFLRMAASVALLAHEAGHLFESETNEAKTECYAVQRVREMAAILGADPAYADQLATVYWEKIYRLNPPDYKTPLCRDGGPLDLDPKSDRWP